MTMRNYDESVEVNHNPNWPYRILIIVGSQSGKTNVLLNLMKHQRCYKDAYKILFMCQSSIQIKHQWPINRSKKV